MRGKRGPEPDRKKTVSRRKPKVKEEPNKQEAIKTPQTRITPPGDRIETAPVALRVTTRSVTLYLSYTLNHGYRLGHIPTRGVIWKSEYPGTEAYNILSTMIRKYKRLSSRRPPTGVHKDIDKHLASNV